MRYEFISRCRVQNGGSSVQRVLLNLGIVCIIIAMVIELMLSNKFAFAFAVPLVYLLSLRGQMGGETGFRDVCTELILSGDTFSLTYSGSIMKKGRLLDQQYLIERDQIRDVTQEREKGKITLLFDGIVKTRESSGRTVRSQRISGGTVPLFLPAEVYGEVIAWLGLQ